MIDMFYICLDCIYLYDKFKRIDDTHDNSLYEMKQNYFRDKIDSEYVDVKLF